MITNIDPLDLPRMKTLARRTALVAWPGSAAKANCMQAKDGKPLTLLSNESMVLRKTGADWRIVHIHWSSRPKKAK